MGNISNIYVIGLLSIVIIISSCKKEDEVPIINGCTDANAMNYSTNANTNDGSCVFAYDIAQGSWNIETACQELNVFGFDVPLNTVFPKNIEILGEGAGVVSMDINEKNIFADILYDGTVTIQDDQKIAIDIPVLGEVDVDISGSGMIQTAINGSFTLVLSFDVPVLGTQSSSCEVTCSR